jgi:hypothetical protein
VPVPPLGDGTAGGVRERLVHVIGGDVHPVDVVERAVVGLRDDRERPEGTASAALRHVCGDQRIAHGPNRMRVGDPDRGGELAGLADPLEARHLAVAVERVGAGEDGGQADLLVGHDDRHARSDRAVPDDERPVAFDQGHRPDAHAGHVGDRVQRSGLQLADRKTQVTEPCHGVGG